MEIVGNNELGSYPGITLYILFFSLAILKKNELSFTIALVTGPYMAIEMFRKRLEKTKWLQVGKGLCLPLGLPVYCSNVKSRLTLLNCLGKLIFISNVYGLLSQKINAKSSKM